MTTMMMIITMATMKEDKRRGKKQPRNSWKYFL